MANGAPEVFTILNMFPAEPFPPGIGPTNESAVSVTPDKVSVSPLQNAKGPLATTPVFGSGKIEVVYVAVVSEQTP